MRGGAAAVKAHMWFAGIDWNALYHKQHYGPLNPKVVNENDTSNFFIIPDSAVSFDSGFSGNQDIFKDF